MDLLAYNSAYAELMGGLGHRTPSERNSLWLLFTDPAMRTTLVDWKAEAMQWSDNCVQTSPNIPTIRAGKI